LMPDVIPLQYSENDVRKGHRIKLNVILNATSSDGKDDDLGSINKSESNNKIIEEDQKNANNSVVKEGKKLEDDIPSILSGASDSKKSVEDIGSINGDFQSIITVEPSTIRVDEIYKTMLQAKDDDPEGYYIIKKDEVLNRKYRIEETLGKGSYAIVAKAKDLEQDKYVALKIIKNGQIFEKQAQNEIEILKKFTNLDPDCNYKTVQFLEYFYHKKHLCLVFELLNMTLYEVNMKAHFKGLPIAFIRIIAHQLFTSLVFLSSNDVNIIHCDLKPDNIMLKEENSGEIRIIDFGSSVLSTGYKFKYAQSRYYRAPEVVFGDNYSFSADMWSVGCILVELLLGRPIFDGNNEVQQIVRFIEYLGMPPLSMIRTCPKVSKVFLFNSSGKCFLNPCIGNHVHSKNLQKLVYDAKVNHPTMNNGVFTKFYDLISKILIYSQEFRLTPLRALHHSFFSCEIVDEYGIVHSPLECPDFSA